MLFNQIYTKKLQTIWHWMLLYFFIVICRLIHLQIIQHEQLKTSSQKNFLRFKVIPAQRGNILDCHGIALATNQPVTQLVWKGTGNIHITDEQMDAISKIYEILQQQEIPLAKINKTEKFKLDLILATSITQEQLCQIAEQCSDISNIQFITTFNRLYPYGNIASHLLGYLGDVDMYTQGKMGLEKICEDTLRGEATILMQSTNSFGSLLNSQELKQGLCGQDIITSIDLNIQNILEKTLLNEISGSCIVLDPQTGLIKALVSKPNFDPSIFSKKIGDEQWQQLQKDKVFLNRVFNATYPPASIFKLVTIAAALEEKIITQDSQFFCSGYSTFKNRKYYCNKRAGHGTVSTKDTLAYSCNIPLYEIAKKIHIDTLANYAFKFGLGTKTNIPFSEQQGLIPTNAWKKRHKGERWWMGETLSASIGQSFLLVTPIQVACMIGSIFHGYLIKPRVTINDPIEKQPLEIKHSTCQFLQECMKGASVFGSAQRVGRVKNLTVYSKTGTAQTKTRRSDQDPDEKYANKEDIPHAWFVSYFYTDHTDPLVMVMLLEHAGRSTYATGVAAKFFTDYVYFVNQTISKENPQL